LPQSCPPPIASRKKIAAIALNNEVCEIFSGKGDLDSFGVQRIFFRIVNANVHNIPLNLEGEWINISQSLA